MRELLQLNSAENKVLMEQYIDFLMTHPVEQQEAVESEIYQDIAQIQKEKMNQSIRQVPANLMQLLF